MPSSAAATATKKAKAKLKRAREAAKKKAKAAYPRTRCPITGEVISITKAGDKWIAHTSLWTTRPFEWKDTLTYTLSFTDGKPPDGVAKPGVEIVRDETEHPGSES